MGEEYSKSTILRFMFDGNKGYEVRDFQRRATATLKSFDFKSPDAMEILWKILLRFLAGNRGMVNEVLMDQRLIRGSVKAYSDDILWHARISPFSVASKIPEKQVNVWYKIA